MHEQIVVSAVDLRFLTLQCGICRASVTLDLEREKWLDAENRSNFVSPGECFNCAEPFDSMITDAVKSMQKAYKALAGVGKTVTFAVPSPAR